MTPRSKGEVVRRTDSHDHTQMEKLGAIIKARREKLGLTLRQLGTEIGASFPNLCHVEQGDRWPSPELLVRIGNRLDMDVDDLMVRAGIVPDSVTFILRTRGRLLLDLCRAWRAGRVTNDQIRALLNEGDGVNNDGGE